MRALEQLAGSTPSGDQAAPEVTIIIPALNEAKMIGRCLEAIARMAVPRDRFEVIVVDNGSADGTRDIAESFRGRLQLRVLQKDGVHISALRNLGAKAARGAVLAFLDADCLAPCDWIACIAELVPGQGSGVAGAHYLLPAESSWVGRTWHRYREAPKSGEVSHVPAGDLIMHREDFMRVGGFDESIQTNEDLELCERVRAAGMTVRAAPRIGVVHLGTAQTLRGFYRKQQWHGSHVVKVFLRDPLHSPNRRAVMFAFFTLTCLALISAGTAWLLLGGPWSLPAVGLAALIVPPFALAWRGAASEGKWTDLIPLAALYLTYGVARARALMRVRNLR